MTPRIKVATGTPWEPLVGDPHAQAVQTLRNIEEALRRAHREFFGAVRPATSMVEVSRLISPEMLVEIEAEAIVPER